MVVFLVRRIFAAGIFCLVCAATPAHAQVAELKVAPWWYFQEQIEDFFAGATQQGPGSGPSSTEGDPPPATETETEWIVKICGITNPLNSGKTVCITLRINKTTGNVRITVDDLIPLPLTYHIRCAEDGKCTIIDDFPPLFRTTFCEIKRDESGAVHYVCRFNYLGLSMDTTIKIYIENGNLCFHVPPSAPECRPFEDLADWIKAIWRDVQPLWLPPSPSKPMEPPAPGEPEETSDKGSSDPLVNSMGQVSSVDDR
jgi:hypothetical protein